MLAEAQGLAAGSGGVLRLAPAGGLTAVPGWMWLAGPAAVAPWSDGSVYVPDAEADRLLRVLCDGSIEAVRCLERGRPGGLSGPRAVAARDDVLLVADTGNHRILHLDPHTAAILEVWGAVDADGQPVAARPPEGFDRPWDLAVLEDGAVIVADRGTKSVERYGREGSHDPAFAAAIAALPSPPRDPALVAMITALGEERLLVVDADDGRVLVLAPDGAPDVDAEEHLIELADAGARFVTREGMVPLRSPNGWGLQFDRDGRLDRAGAVAKSDALALSCEGRLEFDERAGTIHDVQLEDRALALIGPIPIADPERPWDAVRAKLATALAPKAHLRLFSLTTYSDVQPREPDSDRAPAGTSATRNDEWRPAPLDALDVRILNAPGRLLWLAAEFLGDGRATPELAQLRVEARGLGLVERLPRVYAEEQAERETIVRFLSLLSVGFADVEAQVDGLGALVDPAAVSDVRIGIGPSWLDDLAAWVSADLERDWPEDRRRSAVAGALADHARRGTREWLAGRVAAAIGIDEPDRVTIWEPAAGSSLWTLGRGGRLGDNTMLTARAAQGATLDRTADLDHAHLLDDAGLGSGPFDDLAHRFCVSVHAADLCAPGARARVERILERDRPAHTLGRLCVIEPRATVGLQARVGVDLIVAADPDPSLGRTGRLGLDAALGDSPQGTPGNRLGVTTTVGRWPANREGDQ
jgi:phage tail-like protein